MFDSFPSFFSLKGIDDKDIKKAEEEILKDNPDLRGNALLMAAKQKITTNLLGGGSSNNRLDPPRPRIVPDSETTKRDPDSPHIIVTKNGKFRFEKEKDVDGD